MTDYEILVALEAIEPPIWRRIRVPGDTTLHELHLAIQAAMGWQNAHLYQFQTRHRSRRQAGKRVDVPARHTRRTLLQQFITGEGFTFSYVYDMGDGWEHRLLVEKILEGSAALSRTTCVGGARACPPEDCGGVAGYQELVEAMANPQHERHTELIEWLGGVFDPEKFSVYDANTSLRHLGDP